MAMEPRSIEGLSMGKLAPIDVDNLTLEEAVKSLAKGVVQTHACLEQHIAEQTLANLDATERRQIIAGQLLDTRTDVLAIKGDVRDLALALGVKKPEPGEEKPKATGLATWGPVKVLTALSGMSFGLVVLVQLSAKVGPVVWAYLLALSP